MRGFYDFHLEAGSGPMVNPFPLARHRGVGRVDAPQPDGAVRRAGCCRYRPKLATRAPRCIPDERIDQLFAQLGSHLRPGVGRLWYRPGRGPRNCWAPRSPMSIRDSRVDHVDLNSGVAGVPAADAVHVVTAVSGAAGGLVPAGRDEPLWRTLRRPFRPLRYDAARAMFTRANAALGSN